MMRLVSMGQMEDTRGGEGPQTLSGPGRIAPRMDQRPIGASVARPLRFVIAMSRIRILGLLIVLTAAAAGCQSGKKGPPKPFEAPAATFTVEHFSGSPVSGPTTRPVSAV